MAEGVPAMKAAIYCLTAFLSAATAEAGSYTAPEGQHFVALASAKILDEAIGIARLYGDSAQVVSSQSGWYAVILGPTPEPSLEAFKAAYQGWPAIPADAVWSKGNNYIDGAWGADPLTPKALEVPAAAPVETAIGEFKVTATASIANETQSVRLQASDGGKAAFDLTTKPDYYSDFGATLRLVNLDPASPDPETMLTQYTGGAHCCVATWFAAKKDDNWQLSEGAMLDGGGYWLEDVDNDDAYELLSVDNAFLYAFESYAGSFSTIVIQRLRNGGVEDAPHDARWRSRMVQDLAGKEFMAKMEPELWHSNGFLTPWVATKILLGEGEEAWKRMLKTYDRNAEFGTYVCTTGEPIDKCSTENTKLLPYPEALAAFLRDNGYTPVPGQ
jgi:serine protease Do